MKDILGLIFFWGGTACFVVLAVLPFLMYLLNKMIG